MNLISASRITAALLGAATGVQSAGGTAATDQQAQTQPGAPSPGAAAGDSFVTQQSIDQWRAPKLVGVGVFGADDKQVGKIKDLLIDHDGKAQVVVIGVGGFLGLGAKDVGVPFTALRWQTEGRTAPSSDQPPNPVASATGQADSKPPVKRTDPAATEANQGYPDKAVLGMTLEQIKSAPDFKYAPDPLAQLDSRSSAVDALRSKQP